MTKKQAASKTEKHERETRMRELIKKEAFQLMAEKGLDGVSMREIAEKVKVTKPVLYYYFRDKEDLCHSIMAEHEDRFKQTLEHAYEAGRPPLETVKEVLCSQLDFFANNPVNSKFFVQMIAYTLNHHVPADGGPDNFQARLAEYLQKEERAGRLPAGAAADVGGLMAAVSAGIMLSAYIHQHVACRCVKRGVFDRDTLDRMMQLVSSGVKVHYGKKK